MRIGGGFPQEWLERTLKRFDPTTVTSASVVFRTPRAAQLVLRESTMVRFHNTPLWLDLEDGDATDNWAEELAARVGPSAGKRRWLEKLSPGQHRALATDPTLWARWIAKVGPGLPASSIVDELRESKSPKSNGDVETVTVERSSLRVVRPIVAPRSEHPISLFRILPMARSVTRMVSGSFGGSGFGSSTDLDGEGYDDEPWQFAPEPKTITAMAELGSEPEPDPDEELHALVRERDELDHACAELRGKIGLEKAREKKQCAGLGTARYALQRIVDTYSWYRLDDIAGAADGDS
jgi:hypothetical protein